VVVLEAIAKKIVFSIGGNRTPAIQILARCTDIRFYYCKVKVKEWIYRSMYS
jgi:hypothetical protein